MMCSTAARPATRSIGLSHSTVRVGVLFGQDSLSPGTAVCPVPAGFRCSAADAASVHQSHHLYVGSQKENVEHYCRAGLAPALLQRGVAASTLSSRA